MSPNFFMLFFRRLGNYKIFDMGLAKELKRVSLVKVFVIPTG